MDMRRNQWAAAFLALLLFCCGAAVGVLGNRFYSATTVNANDSRQRYLADMKSKLNLTETQVAQFDAILDDTKAKYKAVRDSYRPAMLKIKADHIDRIKSILSAQQFDAYRRIVAEREQKSREQEERERQEEQRRAAARHAAP
jgi:Spy/CpxP family protein refolding chaperone